MEGQIPDTYQIRNILNFKNLNYFCPIQFTRSQQITIWNRIWRIGESHKNAISHARDASNKLFDFFSSTVCFHPPTAQEQSRMRFVAAEHLQQCCRGSLLLLAQLDPETSLVYG